jgi:hypothetical protein
VNSSSHSSSESLVPVVVDHEGQRWALFKAGAEPLCKDLDLAEWLEFERTRNIRALIERYTDDLGPISLYREAKSGSVGRPSEGYYLTESQALFIIAKSETPRATWMLKAMIQVFLKARGLVAVAPADNLGRLEEWNRMRRAQMVHGETLQIVTGDISRLGHELAAQREYIETLDARMHRNMPTKEQRDAQAQAIKEACECRANELERRLLGHVASEGPATSCARMGAAAGCRTSHAARLAHWLVERAVMDSEQRDPSMPNLRNYYVLLEGLQGHAVGCEHGDDPQGQRALSKMLELTSEDAAVHVVPPSIPQILVPPSSSDLSLTDAESPPGRSARDEVHDFVEKTCYENGLSYKDFWSQLWSKMAFEGKECRHRSSKGRRISKLDYCEAHGWSSRALEIAKSINLRNVLRDPQSQRVGNA